jgi:hypothetical protein
MTPSTLYAGSAGLAGNGVVKSTDAGATWEAAGLTLGTYVLAIDPLTPSTLYAGTRGGGVFSIQQVAACTGDCDGNGAVAITELIVGVNIVLAIQPETACPAFANAQALVDIAQLMKGVNNALNGCTAG